ncbi:hypothetical protein P4E94_11610 [Pontiellaceae bacterium B12219]|nr:hypothetical protein [Pontiellaceae bacterium B12219]
MKWIKTIMTAAVLTAVLPSVRATIEKPKVMDGAMLSLTVSDLSGFIDQAGSVAAQVSPGMSGEMLKMLLGMQLGDPSMAGIPAGKGFSIVALDPTNIFAVVEVTDTQSAAYISTAKAKGLESAYAEGMLVLAGTPDAVKKGVSLQGQVKKSLLSSRSSTLRLALQPAAVVERNQEAIDGFVQMMPALLGQGMMTQPGATLESVANVSKVLEAEMLVLISLAKQCETAEVVLAPKNGSLQLSKTLVPKAGTALHTLMTAPEAAKRNPKLTAGQLGGGTILADFYFANSEALGTFVGAETEKLIPQLNLEDVDAAEVAATMKKMMSLYSGTGCEAISFGDDGAFKVRYVMEVKDEATTLEVLRTIEADMGPFLQLYETLGMPMELIFKENVRSANGTPVHQFSVKMDMLTLPAEQRDQIETMGLDEMVYELALKDGQLFYSEPGGIEALMERVKDDAAAAPLKARSVYPAGGCFYFDMDVGGYLGFVATTMPDDPATAMVKQQMGTLFQGVPPVTAAGFKEDGRMMWSVNLPGELLAKYGQMIMMMQMQMMQPAQ